MKFSSNKEKGNSGLGMAIAYFSSNGYVVSIPLNDTQDYDLVIEKDGKLAKVQVKATGCKTKNNIYQLSLKSCGGTYQIQNLQHLYNQISILCQKKTARFIVVSSVVQSTTRKMDIPAQVCNDTDVKIVIVHGLKIMETVFDTLIFQRTHGKKC